MHFASLHRSTTWEVSSGNMNLSRGAFITILYVLSSYCNSLRLGGLSRLVKSHICHIKGVRNLFMAESGESLHPISVGNVDLETYGDDIVVLAPENGVTKIVMKFGGSSLASAERITYVSKLIKKHVEKGYRPIIICSAMGKTTNTLISAGDFALSGNVYVDSLRTLHLTTAQQLGVSDSTINSVKDLLSELEKLLEGIKFIGELTPRTKDSLVSFGERMAVRIVAGTLNKLGVPSQSFDAWTLGMRTTSEFGNAEVRDETYANVKSILGNFDGMIVPVVTGFIGHDDKGRITTLGRVAAICRPL